jgi:hypothetical protein
MPREVDSMGQESLRSWEELSGKRIIPAGFVTAFEARLRARGFDDAQISKIVAETMAERGWST